MSHTTAVAPRRTAVARPDADTPGRVVPAQRRPGLTARLRRSLETTPGQLRTAAVIGVLVSLVFALIGGNAFRARGAALDQARADAQQLVRVQQIATDLTAADAVVTNAFLLGAKEPPDTYAQFQTRIDDASTLLAKAAQAQPGDATALAAVNQALSRYTADVATARVNNRLFFQTGGGYLRQASNLLRTPATGQPAMLPTLQSVVKTDAQRVEDDFGAARLALIELAIAAVVVLAGLAAVQVWLARRTRRILNIPMTWGTGAVFLTILLGAIVMIGSQGTADEVHDTTYAATNALAQARIAAYDAKANESLTLVYQGSGQQFETAYQGDLSTMRTQLAAAKQAGVSDAGETYLDAWNAAHQKIRSADDKGDWPTAVQLATSTTGSSAKAYTAFADLANTTGTALQNQSSAVSNGLGSSWSLVALGWLTLIVGLLAAVLAWAGVGQRLGEYR